jgi:hypothetical protein
MGKNGSRRWVSVEGGDERKKKIKNRLTAENLTKRARKYRKGFLISRI